MQVRALGRSAAVRMLLATTILTIGVAMVSQGTTSAAGLLPTTTQVTAHPSTTVAPNTDITFEAAVGDLALIITPAGTVRWTTGGRVLDVTTLDRCLIITKPKCIATLTVNSNRLGGPGFHVVRGTYTGDGISQPSSGTVTVFVTGGGNLG